MPTNEAEEAERGRILALANEDLRKTVPASLADVLQAATVGFGPEGVRNTTTLYRHAAFLAVLSIKADEQAAKNLAVQSKTLRITKIFLVVSIIFGLATVLQFVLQLLK